MSRRVVTLHPQWKQACIGPDGTLREAIETIDRAVLQIALVVDENRRLLGVLTDGDIRRALLQAGSLEVPVRAVMNTAPVTASVDTPKGRLRQLMRSRGVQQVPLVDDQGCLAGVVTLPALLQKTRRDNPVLLMAGGFGTRLRPLTDHLPKPLLRVGGRPILEHILQRFVEAGFETFYISVHYRAEMIKAYFGEGEKWGVTIRYLEEKTPLGTGGCLKLLPDALERDLIVMNGDVLTEVDFTQLLAFHETHEAEATVCVRPYSHQIPFGVVETTGDRMVAMVEKPIYTHFVNAGIYVLSPAFVEEVPEGRQDIPDLLQRAVARGGKVATFPMHEYWRDIGRPDDFQQAQADYALMYG